MLGVLKRKSIVRVAVFALLLTMTAWMVPANMQEASAADAVSDLNLETDDTAAPEDFEKEPTERASDLEIGEDSEKASAPSNSMEGKENKQQETAASINRSEDATAEKERKKAKKSAANAEESTSELVARDSTVPSPAEAYAAMIALKEQDAYKEGTTWTNDEPYSDSKGYYHWNGGPLGGANISAVGCVAFAFILSDAAFGSLPARMFAAGDFNFEDIKVGDILRVSNDAHTVIVLEVSDAGVVVAEGNISTGDHIGKVHWGRAISKAEVMNSTSHYITRYPEGYVLPDDPTANDIVKEGTLDTGLTWKLTKAGTLTISGQGAMPDFSSAEEQPWNEHSSQIRKVLLEDGVTSIGSCAFWNCGVLSAEIPSSVTAIGNSAFRGSSIISVTIPSSVKTIGDSAFRECQSLSSATVSEGLETIEQNAFRACTSLTSIDLPASIGEVGAGAFFQCEAMTKATFAPGSKKVTLGDNLFTQCYYLMNVTLPQSIDCISEGMFQNCLMLPGVEIPQGAESIGASAFASCSGFTTVLIPDSVTTIGIAAFSACPLKDIYFTGDEATWNSISKIGDTASAVAKATIHYNYTPTSPDLDKVAYEVTGGAIYFDKETGSIIDADQSVTKADIPTQIDGVSVKRIGEKAFEGCSGLTSVTIPNSVTEIDETAFVDYKGSIKGSAGSAAEKYAAAHNITFEAIDSEETTEPSDPSTEPVDPTGESTATPTNPTTPSVTPTNPITPAEPTVSPTTPTEPATKPTEPSTDPTEPSTEPEKPSVPTEPEQPTTANPTEKPAVSTPIKTGTVVQDKDSKASYVVTKTGNSKTVTYKEPTNSKKTAITIPATVNIAGKNYKVTKIADKAFKSNSKIKSVKIGANIQTVGAKAFKNCTNLNKVVIPSKVTTIEKGAFANCKNLESITIKTTKLTSKSIETNAFKGIAVNARVKTPAGKIKTYKKLLQAKGLSKKAIVK